MFDLGCLSENEFRLYTSLISTETVDPDDWKRIEGKDKTKTNYSKLSTINTKILSYVAAEAVALKKNELTREGFIHLYQIELSNDLLNDDDAWSRLLALGFNKSLRLDQVRYNKFEIF